MVDSFKDVLYKLCVRRSLGWGFHWYRRRDQGWWKVMSSCGWNGADVGTAVGDSIG